MSFIIIIIIIIIIITGFKTTYSNVEVKLQCSLQYK